MKIVKQQLSTKQLTIKVEPNNQNAIDLISDDDHDTVTTTHNNEKLQQTQKQE